MMQSVFVKWAIVLHFGGIALIVSRRADCQSPQRKSSKVHTATAKATSRNDTTDTTRVQHVVLPLDVGQVMPHLTVRAWVNGSTEGARLPVGDGHVYVLAFTAHWCGPCRKAYPMLEALQAQYAARGVRLVYLTQLWGYYETQQSLSAATELDSLQSYARAEHVTAPFAVVDDKVKLRGVLPFQMVIDEKGVVRAAVTGYDGWPVLTGALETILGPKPATP